MTNCCAYCSIILCILFNVFLLFTTKGGVIYCSLYVPDNIISVSMCTNYTFKRMVNFFINWEYMYSLIRRGIFFSHMFWSYQHKLYSEVKVFAKDSFISGQEIIYMLSKNVTTYICIIFDSSKLNIVQQMCEFKAFFFLRV